MTSDWTDVCSICFENRCEFNFPRCQDQFCVACIERCERDAVETVVRRSSVVRVLTGPAAACTGYIYRYLTEVINNSWGLPVCVIKCPACNDVLPKYTWSKVRPEATE